MKKILFDPAVVCQQILPLTVVLTSWIEKWFYLRFVTEAVTEIEKWFLYLNHTKKRHSSDDGERLEPEAKEKNVPAEKLLHATWWNVPGVYFRELFPNTTLWCSASLIKLQNYVCKWSKFSMRNNNEWQHVARQTRLTFLNFDRETLQHLSYNMYWFSQSTTFLGFLTFSWQIKTSTIAVISQALDIWRRIMNSARQRWKEARLLNVSSG